MPAHSPDDGIDPHVSEVYENLRAIAHRFMAQHPKQTLQPTALVHEAYLQLSRERENSWEDKGHVLGVAAKAMRDILVDAARRRVAHKRGGGRHRVTLSNSLAADQGGEPVDLLALDEALGKLGEIDERMAKVVELRLFAGLTGDEIATAIGTSRKTVVRDLAGARMWLLRAMDGGTPSAHDE